MRGGGGQGTEQTIHRQGLQNHACREGQHLLGQDVQQARGFFARLLCFFQTRLTRTCIGIASIDDQGTDAIVGSQVRFAHLHWSGTETVGGEHTGHAGAGGQFKHGQVASVGLANTGFGNTDFDTGNGVNIRFRGDEQIDGHDAIRKTMLKAAQSNNDTCFEPPEHSFGRQA